MKDIKTQNRKILLSQRRVKILRDHRKTEKGRVYEAIMKTRTDEAKLIKREGKRNSRIKSDMARKTK